MCMLSVDRFRWWAAWRCVVLVNDGFMQICEIQEMQLCWYVCSSVKLVPKGVFLVLLCCVYIIECLPESETHFSVFLVGVSDNISL